MEAIEVGSSRDYLPFWLKNLWPEATAVPAQDYRPEPEEEEKED